MKKLDKSTLYIGLIETVLKKVGQLVVLLAVFYLAEKYGYAAPLAIKALLVTVWVFTTLRMVVNECWYYKKSHYRLDEETIFSRTGGWLTEEMTVPMSRVQHVSVSQTFLSRLFNVFAVIVYTAGDSLELAYVSDEEAQDIKKRITDYLIEKGEDN